MNVGFPAAECAVVIPYFQRTEESFLKALESVFAQTYRDFVVIIVDDASPLPAAKVVAQLDEVSRDRVRIIVQENKGPGGARNTGLDAIPDGVRFVAFLDSDDLWDPRHLERSIAHMTSLGADCVWSLVSADAEFDPYYPVHAVANRDLIRSAEGDGTVFFIDDLPRFILYKWWHFLHLSTFVVTRRIFETARFRPYFRLAGEDLMFFYDCAKAARALVVSTEVGASRGMGHNFYVGTEFGSPKAVRQMFYSIRAIQILSRENRFIGRDADMLRDWQRETREHALRNMMSGLVRRRWSMIPTIGAWLLHDLRMMPASFRMAARVLSERRTLGTAGGQP